MLLLCVLLIPIIVYGMAALDQRRARKRGEDPNVVHFAARLYAYKTIVGPLAALIAMLLFALTVK